MVWNICGLDNKAIPSTTNIGPKSCARKIDADDIEVGSNRLERAPRKAKRLDGCEWVGSSVAGAFLDAPLPSPKG